MRALVVEDERDDNRHLVATLTGAGFSVDAAFDGDGGYHLGLAEPYDIAIINWGLPKIDGLSVLEQWRRDGLTMPVIVTSARDGWRAKIRALDAGASDYIVKPYHMAELLDRVRGRVTLASGDEQTDLEFGPLYVDTKAARVTIDGQLVHLKSREYRLLTYLIRHRGRPVSRIELVEHLFDLDFDPSSNIVDVLVSRLRRQLPPTMIKSVRGVGYRFSNEPNAD